jgi:hypothetical protein
MEISMHNPQKSENRRIISSYYTTSGVLISLIRIQMNRLKNICMVEYYSVIKKNEIILFTEKWMELEIKSG